MFYFNEFDLFCWLWRRVVVIVECLQGGLQQRLNGVFWTPETTPKWRLLNAWNGVCHCTTVWKRRHNSFSLAWSGVPSPPLALDLLFVFLKNVLVKMGTATKLRYQLSDVYSPLSPKNITRIYIYIYQALKIHAFLSTLEHTWTHCLPMMNKIWIF